VPNVFKKNWLKRIAGAICITQLISHVSLHRYAYYMLCSGASFEELSIAMNHFSIEITQYYLKQFPKQFSDVDISRFPDWWEI
jgi:site-specific recombinase XerD